ncbi:GntP family gluconate:H+ symporter [Lactobacillus colini]|uniref:GntP family gluconate:H+ symporter n=1 Tax=Lactobacillus colini TaxID=1819254 RepID=A0ABS4MBZ3_9LACO|nr:SLC13 family permease [Lactobacillus colini]MBP2057198.1 GntP family gluconate:H+ symporter [Lactobacillus colini]
MGSLTISWIAALFGLLAAICLIIKKVNPVYSLFIGAIVGCLFGGASIAQTTQVIINGTQSIMGTAVRVLTAGILAGVMMESGAADVIAHKIVSKLGDKMSLLALALSTMILTAVGVFIPVAVLIVAPIALSVGKRMHISKLALLVALSGGGKAGNIASPNPNTIAAANGFKVPLSNVMLAGYIPAIFGLIVAVLVASLIKKKGSAVTASDIEPPKEITDISLLQALCAPILAIILLMIGPIGQALHINFLANISIDAFYVLPIASIIGAIAMGKWKQIPKFMTNGLSRVTDTVLILIGAGAIAGLISTSDLSIQVVHLISDMKISGTLLAPLSGILMGLATGSTSTAVIVTTGSFGNAILQTGTTALAAAVMVQAGATVIDQVPQGNYFHITAHSMHMSFKERAQAMPFEICVGLTTTLVATILYGYIL